jgi:hypothetical protein
MSEEAMEYLVYEYLIIHRPKAKKDEDQLRPELIQGLRTAIASSEQEVLIMASRQIPERYQNKLDEVDIAIRPF